MLFIHQIKKFIWESANLPVPEDSSEWKRAKIPGTSKQIITKEWLKTEILCGFKTLTKTPLIT